MCICKGLKKTQTNKLKELNFSITFWELCMELLDLQGMLLLPGQGRNLALPGTSWVNQSSLGHLPAAGCPWIYFSLGSGRERGVTGFF